MPDITFIGWCWVAFFAVWIVTAIRVKPVQSAESIAGSLGYRLFTVLGGVLLVNGRLAGGLLNVPIIPWSRTLLLIGDVLAALGVAFAIWARIHLGRNWSATVTIRADHGLIRSGPYARIRHPIYTGMMVAVIGTALASDTYRAALGVVLISVSFWLKARREESALSQEFGLRFDEHRRATGMFLPRLS
jgi:protein-S-isoprenylcysteine O-methyltransferase Ste14